MKSFYRIVAICFGGHFFLGHSVVLATLQAGARLTMYCSYLCVYVIISCVQISGKVMNGF